MVETKGRRRDRPVGRILKLVSQDDMEKCRRSLALPAGSDNRNAEPVHAVVVFSIVLPLTRPKTPDTPKPFEQIWKSCNGVYI